MLVSALRKEGEFGGVGGGGGKGQCCVLTVLYGDAESWWGRKNITKLGWGGDYRLRRVEPHNRYIYKKPKHAFVSSSLETLGQSGTVALMIIRLLSLFSHPFFMGWWIFFGRFVFLLVSVCVNSSSVPYCCMIGLSNKVYNFKVYNCKIYTNKVYM